MNINEHTTPERLERYAFLWSLVRMVIAAFSLFFGAMPIAYMLAGPGTIVGSLMPLFWLISGVAAIYLLYRWYSGGQRLFGSHDTKDTVAFMLLVVTGINLGYAAINTNIGINFAYDMAASGLIFKVTAIVYLVVVYHLWQRWNASGERIFSTTTDRPGGGASDADLHSHGRAADTSSTG